jgi:hypothetical protein
MSPFPLGARNPLYVEAMLVLRECEALIVARLDRVEPWPASSTEPKSVLVLLLLTVRLLGT